MAVSLLNRLNLRIGALYTRRIIVEALPNNRQLATMSESLNEVPDVDIDGHGKFKYILINVKDEANNVNKSIVRGYARAQWHGDIFDEVNNKLKSISGLTTNCLGGGRIEHDPDEKTIKVYGYSQGFGKADHEVSVALLKKKYPDYTITCSDDGY
ncbi:sex-regulated protein janus-A-like [Ceratina calcarata]|uniref:Sex-regulated protein janus-A n=1 Tax=Ceratina calcarata TaxID=156304 RepID=A0AAJ7J7N3_9HYME|nr:sex-regulated protein janus-A-like [Ceratina calcarata]